MFCRCVYIYISNSLIGFICIKNVNRNATVVLMIYDLVDEGINFTYDKNTSELIDCFKQVILYLKTYFE